MPTPERRDLTLLTEPGALTVEAAADGQQGADGKPALPRFNLVAYTGGAMRVASWYRPIVVDLAGLSIPSQTRPIRFQHDPSAGVGHTESIGIQDNRLIAAGVVSRETEAAREIVASAKKGFPWQASIQAAVEKFEAVDEKQTAKVNGRQFSGPLYVIRKGTLGEISIVDLGADDKTAATLAASQAKNKESHMELFDKFIGAMGLVKAELSEPQIDALQERFDKLQAAGLITADGTIGAAKPKENQNAPGNPPGGVLVHSGSGVSWEDPSQTIRVQAAAEVQRIAAVNKVASGHPEIAARAIAEGWDANRTELEVLRASRPTPPNAIMGAGNGSITGEQIEAALCLTGRLAQPEKAFAAAILEQAAANVGRIGLQEAIMLAAAANGWRGRMTASAFRAAHKEILGRAFGGVQAAGFSNIDIAGILSNVANKFLLASFNAVEAVWRSISVVRPVGDFKTNTRYRLTGAGGYEKVAPDGELKHGTLGQEFYTNKADTYGKILAITRQDQYNDDLGALTQVPSLLGGDAGRALNEIFWSEFQDNAAFFTEARGNYIPGAARAWHLLADPAELPVMEVVFLDGRDSPVVESAETDFNTLGIQMRSYHDWGCAKAEYRAGLRSKVALGLTSLGVGEAAFLDQKQDGHPLGIRPRLLLVASGDSVMARSLYVSTEIRDTTANTKAPTANVFQGLYTVLVSSYLANA